jgi:hypothetical protein
VKDLITALQQDRRAPTKVMDSFSEPQRAGWKSKPSPVIQQPTQARGEDTSGAATLEEDAGQANKSDTHITSSEIDVAAESHIVSAITRV